MSSKRRKQRENEGLPARWRWRYGAYRYVVPPGREADWNGQREFRLGATLSEAYRTWAERLVAIEREDLSSVAKLCDAFLDRHVPTLSPKAQESYRLAVRRIRAVFGPLEVGDIGQQHARKFYTEIRDVKSAATARATLAVLKTMLTFAAEAGTIASNPLLGMRFVGAKKRKRHIKDWEVAAMLALSPTAGGSAASGRGVEMLQLYIRLKLMTGLRRGDLLRLRLSDLKDDGIHVMPHKTQDTTGLEMIFPWSEELRVVVADARRMPPRRIGDAPLFVTRRGEPYVGEDGRANGFDSIWRRFVTRVVTETAVDERFQEKDLRAKVGSDLPTVEEAQRRLGHSSPVVTERNYRRAPVVIEPLSMARFGARALEDSDSVGGDVDSEPGETSVSD